MAPRMREGRPVDRLMFARALFLASAWTFFGAAALAEAAPPLSLVDQVIAVLTAPGPFIILGLLLAYCVQPVWSGTRDDP